jgi:hypothetical protein
MTQVQAVRARTAERKMGGKPLLRLFVQESDDLTMSLLSSSGGSEGDLPVNSLVRQRHQGAFGIEVLEHRAGRSDLLLQEMEGTPMPEELSAGPIAALGSRQSSSLFDEDVDLVVLSGQAELTQTLWRHAATGYLITPPRGWEREWDSSTAQWFAQHFTPAEPLHPSQLKETLERLVAVVKQRLGAHVIAFNASSFDPDDHVHTYRGVEDTLAIHVQRLNLALMKASVYTGMSIVDVDRLIAELGGEQHVVQALQYSADAYRAMREEFVRVLEDIGFFEHRWLTMQVGQRSR